MTQKDTFISDSMIEVPVVGVGYSAGGLEAAKKLFSQIPADTGLAFVVIQHLQAGHKSHLADILAKSSNMPVRTIENGMRVEPNTVFVIPPDYDVVLNGDFLNLNPRGGSTVHHLCIDFFFASLSQNRKSKAIGIVLSGTGADGTLGLKAIKSEGGITIVQDPKTAQFDGMPRSAIGSGIADLILAPESIAAELSRLAKHPYTKTALQVHLDSSRPPEPSNPTAEGGFLSKILEILLQQTKVDFSLYKSSTIRRRIERQMMLRKIETIDKYAEYLQKNTEEVKALYEDIFIHVTDFFRDPDTFEALREKAFPELVKEKGKDTPIRVWVPGCATGEEVYSLAISMLEYLEQNGLAIPLQLFASDISEPALQKARKGIYADYQMQNVSQKRLATFFEKMKDGYKISKRVRDLCIFSRHDVTSNPPIPRVDLISCRNVLIYFSAELQKRLFPVFHYALTESGFLWLGRAENPEATSKLFIPVDKTHKIFIKARATFAQQPRFSTPNYSAAAPEISSIPAPSTGRIGDMARNADQLILYRYSPPSVLIDSNGEILQFRGRTVPYLEPSPGIASHSLLKMANPEIAASLRVCLQAAKKQNAHARKEGVEFEFEGKARRTNIDVSPLNPSASPKDRQYLVVFEESSHTKAAKGKAKSPTKTEDGKKAALPQLETLTQINAQLRQELDAAREYQQSLIEEYEASQEELTSANEELRSTNEELQSTNEELHSTNEELGSAKEELQAANEELLSTNEELQKRNVDLESAIREVDTGERRFRLMIDSVKDYAIFMLDPEGHVATWNEGARRLKGYEADEIIGQHFSRFYPEEEKATKPPMELREAARLGRVEDEGWRIRKDGSRFWANVVITALRDHQGKLVGFAKVTRDLTERREAEERLRLSEERARLMTAEVKDYAIFMLDTDGRVASWNEGAKRIKGYDAKEIIGSHFSRFYTPEDIARNHPTEELKIVDKEGRYEEEGWRVKKDGSRFWASVTITRINDPAGKHLGYAKVTRDLTERRKAEEARIEEQRKIAMLEQAKENEVILDQIFSEAPSFMALLSVPDFRFLKSNAQHQKLIGKSDVVGKSMLEVEPELESQGIVDLLKQVAATGKPFIAREMPIHYASVNGDGGRTAYLDFVYQPLRRADGEVYAIAAQGYEVTENVLARKAIERAKLAVENERENFRNLFKQTPEMVCILKGPDHIFEFVNEAHVRALGFDATGMAVREAQPESKEVHGILDEVFRTGETAALHEIPVTVTDRLRYFNLTYSARRDEDGEINGVMVLGVEVTDQVQTRENLKKAIYARDEFLSIASHELKTPLTSLQMQAQLRKRKALKGDATAFATENLIKMFEADKYHIERLTRLIDDMLDVTRIASARLTIRPEPADLRSVLGSAIERLSPQYAAAGNRIVTQQLDSCLGSFDPFRIEQVFVNLLTNALRYGEGKPVEVSLEKQEETSRLTVKDQGIGIAPEDQERIFQQFERATQASSSAGLGLGLYIASQIVKAHGGTIRVESDIGKGATFIVELPLGDFQS